MAKTKAAPTVRRITVKIDGIEGVESATLQIESGHLNIYQGANGAGKTSAARAISRALGGKVDDLEMRDGATLGTVVVTEGEVTSSAIVSKGRVRLKGEAPITAMDTKALTYLITGEDLVGEAARNAARIANFLKIVRPAVDLQAVEILTERDPEMGAWLNERLAAGAIPPDLLSAAERLKVELQRRAREDNEKLAENYAGEESANLRRAADLEAQLAELSEDDPLLAADLPFAEAAVERLAAEHDERKRSAEERARQEADREAIRAAGAPRPDVDGALAQVQKHLEARNVARAEVHEIEAKMERLKAEALAASRRDDEFTRLGKEAEIEWRRLEGEAKLWDTQQALLSSPATGATAEEVEGARLRLEAARSTRDAARLSGEIATAKAAAAEAKALGEKLAARGKQLRDWSLSVRDRVADLLAKSGADGFTVVDGALSFEGKDFDSRLSAGQKVAAAVSLAARFWSGFVHLEADFFGRLDVEHRAELDAFCASRLDLIVTTEEPTEGALSVVHGVAEEAPRPPAAWNRAGEAPS